MAQINPRSSDTAEQTASQGQEGQPTADTEVPERPALAPNIQLVGEM
jgi:hypothetical protein